MTQSENFKTQLISLSSCNRQILLNNLKKRRHPQIYFSSKFGSLCKLNFKIYTFLYLQNCPHYLKLKLHYRLLKTSPLARILSQMNPLQTFPYYFLNIRFNIFLAFTSSLHSLRFSPPKLSTNFTKAHVCHMPPPISFSFI